MFDIQLEELADQNPEETSNAALRHKLECQEVLHRASTSLSYVLCVQTTTPDCMQYLIT